MSFSVEITSRKDTKGAIVHAVIVIIDGHETVLTFQSREDAESFAHTEHARLMENEKNASHRVREIAYRLWQEEGCPRARPSGIGLRLKPFSMRRRPSASRAVAKGGRAVAVHISGSTGDGPPRRRPTQHCDLQGAETRVGA